MTTANELLVHRYMDGFRSSDHEAILPTVGDEC